jgi:hypothetical protein
MRISRKDKQTKEASDKRTIALVTREMRRPRFAKSAQSAADVAGRKADAAGRKKVGNLTKHHVARAAKAHIERYGTGTPPIEDQS